MRALAIILFSLFVSSPTLASDPMPPAPEEINAWSSSAINDLGPEVVNMVPVTLKSGEQAYLAAVEYQHAGRNFWAGYLLVRPSLSEARALDEFGGQYNGIQIVDPHLPSQSAVIVGSSASGQGTSESSYSVVVFDGWTAESLYTVEESDNSGECGAVVGRNCSGNRVFLNVFSGLADGPSIGLVATNVRYSSPDIETTPYTYSVESELVFLER